MLISKKTPTYPKGAYPRNPKKKPNERNSFINCWLGVWGMFQGYVEKVLEIRILTPKNGKNYRIRINGR